MASLAFLKEMGLKLFARTAVQTRSDDLFTQVPDSLKNNGGVPPAKPESRPRRMSASALRRQLDEAAQESLTSRHVFHARQ